MHPVKILVLAERWVIVGEVIEQDPAGLFLTLGKSGVARYWGTTKGLGQLAREGPQPDTKIDLEPHGGKIGTRWILREVQCNQEAWQKWTRQTS